MDDWEKLYEISSPVKKDFYHHLIMEDILIQIMHTKKEIMKI